MAYMHNMHVRKTKIQNDQEDQSNLEYAEKSSQLLVISESKHYIRVVPDHRDLFYLHIGSNIDYFEINIVCKLYYK